MKTVNKRTAVGMAVALALMGSTAEAAEVWLEAREMSFQPAEPGATAVPMWGYVQCTANFAGCPAASTAWAPGPVLNVPVGDTSLIVHLQNKLPVATSLSVLGMQSSASLPARTNASAPLSALTNVEAPANGTATYTFTNVRPGTFLYQSASDPRVQVQMGLYGAVAAAYPSSPSAGPLSAVDEVLVFSEIDAALHTTPTAAGMRNYAPRYFLINGKPDGLGAGAGPTADTGYAKRLRLVNAGLMDRAPQLLGEYFRIESQDGLAVPAALRHAQYNTLLPAGGTLDVTVTAQAPGVYPLYDRKLGLVNGSQPGGMRTTLTVTGAPPPLQAAPDTYPVVAGTTLNIAAPGVLGNDSPLATTATLVPGSGPVGGGLTFNADGSFAYVAPATAGARSFQYIASNLSGSSSPQTVTLNVTAPAQPPVGVADIFYVTSNRGTQNFAAPGVLVNDTDPEGAALTAVNQSAVTLTGGAALNLAANKSVTLPLNANGSLSFAANGDQSFVGTASFTYQAQDPGGLTSGATEVRVVKDLQVSSGVRSQLLQSRLALVTGTLRGFGYSANQPNITITMRIPTPSPAGCGLAAGTSLGSVTVSNADTASENSSVGWALALGPGFPNSSFNAACNRMDVEASVPATASGVPAHTARLLQVPIPAP
ncbi:MAG: Ig-like domain-containing protein [Steroidobacteraceae bacterium]